MFSHALPLRRIELFDRAAIAQDAHIIREVLGDLSLRSKLTFLVCSLLMDDPSATIENLLDVSLIMAKRLPPSQRLSFGT